MNMQVVNSGATSLEQSDGPPRVAPPPAGLSRLTALIFAIACGLSVANVISPIRCSTPWRMILLSRRPRLASW